MDLIDFNNFDWLERLSDSVVLKPGELTPNEIEVPVANAQEIAQSVVRLVLNLPRNSNPKVVWSQGDSELLIHSDKTKLSCSSGVVRLSVLVECDQCKPVNIPIPIGVGSRRLPSGLVMTSFSDLQGPQEIVSIWADALTAFAWETLLETAKVISAEIGNDSRGRALVPGSIGAAPGILLIQTVARHTLSIAV